MNRRVVITGLGVVTSIGIGWREFWDNLIKGKSGISPVSSFDTSNHFTHNGGEVKIFKSEGFIAEEHLPFMNRATQMAVAAAKLAVEDAHLLSKDLAKYTVGVSHGTTLGAAQAIEDIDLLLIKDEEVSKELCYQLPTYAPPSAIAEKFKLHGPNFMFSTACAAGNYAIAYAYDLIRLNRADMVIAGASDPFSRIEYTGFNQFSAVAPEKCQPFDKNRKGMTTSSVEGIAACMRKALQEADITIDAVDYISAHGTGTPTNDKNECAAIKEVFGRRYRNIPVSSIKSMLGHTMGAASAIETIACALVIENDIIPPTINFETPDPECDIDCVPNKARKYTVNIALNNSYAFGGNNASIVLNKFA